MSSGGATPSVWGSPPVTTPPGPLPRRAEVVVVGGGITGVSLLAALRARDVDAVLLERDRVASGASGRNAGFLLAGVAENYARAVGAYGRDVARSVWHFTLENHAMIAAALHDQLHQVGHRVSGSLTVAVDDDEASSLEEAATLLHEDGLPGRLAADSPEGARRVLLNASDGEVDPVRLLAVLAAPHAARIHEGTPVTAIEPHGGGVEVHAAAGSISAARVVLATNAWTPQLAPAVPIRPVRAQMLATAPAAAPAGMERPVYAQWGHRYWRRRDDGCVLVGGFRHRAMGDEVGYELQPTGTVQAHLDRQLADLGVRAAVTHRWAGTMGFSPDGLPLVGDIDGMPHVSVCGGYTGHGLGFAVHCAAVLTAQLLDGAPLPSWIHSRRSFTARLSA